MTRPALKIMVIGSQIDGEDEQSNHHVVSSNEQRQAIYQLLLTKLRDGKPVKGAFTEIAGHFSVGWKTVSRIWSRAQQQISEGALVPCVDANFGACGRKKTIEDISSVLVDVPLNRRSTIRSMAKATGIPRSTLGRKEGTIRRHSNSIKPLLTDSNKIERLKFCLSMLQEGTNSFQNMFDIVHVDEKWFFMTKASRTYYLADGEPEPLRSCKSKRFIEKVMFLAAIARLRYNQHRKTQFDDKLGIWPFVIKEPANRGRKNRVVGTLVTKPITVTKESYRCMLLENVLPAIRSRWPRSMANSCSIFIQQDNAKPHLSSLDKAFVEAAGSDGFGSL